MANLQTKKLLLKDVEAEIVQRRAYLLQINREIESVTQSGTDAIRDTMAELRVLEDEKARLMQQNFGLEQSIRENKLKLHNPTN